jgi:hypothetical protein
MSITNPLTFGSTDDVTAQEYNVLRQYGGLYYMVTAQTIASSTWATIGGVSFEVTKQFSNTTLLVTMAAPIAADTIGFEIKLGLLIGLSPYEVTHHNYGDTNVPHGVGGTTVVSMSAGASSIQAIWQRAAGTGTGTLAAGYPLSVIIREVLY